MWYLATLAGLPDVPCKFIHKSACLQMLLYNCAFAVSSLAVYLKDEKGNGGKMVCSVILAPVKVFDSISLKSQLFLLDINEIKIRLLL